MAKYTVKLDPRPTDRVYIKLSGRLDEIEYRTQGDTTIELNEEPKEITIRRECTLLRSCTRWRCRYVTVTSLDSEKEFYFPVFRQISSDGWTVKENAAKLPQYDQSDERQESLEKCREFQESISQHGKGIRDISTNVSSEDRTVQEQVQAFSVPKSLITGNLRRRETVQTVPESVISEMKHSGSIGKKKESTSFIASIIYTILDWILYFIGAGKEMEVDHKLGLPAFVKGGNIFALQKELWFQTRKLLTLFNNVAKAAAQNIFRKCWNCTHKWKKIDDIRNVFWFASKKAEYVSCYWKDDAFFGNLFLNGCNPTMIKRYTEDQQKIPMETLEKLYPDIRENINNGSIYVVDYALLDGLSEGKIQKLPQYLAAPIVLLQASGEDLKPIAIQLKQTHAEDNPVFTPQDKPEAWVLAKMWVRNSDFYIHELVSHLLRTHLMGEVFFIASYHMAPRHPLSRLLLATGRYTLPINIAARNRLLNKGGFFTECTAIGDGEQWEILKRATREINYVSLCLPDNLKHRGVENLKNFHYKDDSKAIWDAILEFVQEAVYGCYKNDEEVCGDNELKKMVESIHQNGFLCKPDCPSSLNTREEAIKYITMIMFTCSAQHAAVNHGQYDIYAWMPNGPTTMRLPVPTDKKVTEQHIMETLPDIGITLQAMQVTSFLSQVTNDFEPVVKELFASTYLGVLIKVPLGEYPEEVACEGFMREPVQNFQKKLKEIGENITRRSHFQDFPYEYLHPAGIENSITI